MARTAEQGEAAEKGEKVMSFHARILGIGWSRRVELLEESYYNQEEREKFCKLLILFCFRVHLHVEI